MKSFLFCLCLFISVASFSQDADSVKQPEAVDVRDEYDDEDSYALPDSTEITPRSPDKQVLERLKADPTLQYKQPPTIAESLWDRFILWLKQLFSSMFESAVTTDWGNVFAYVVGIVLLVVLIMAILRVNAFKVFTTGQGIGTFRYGALDENIHEMDFDKLIDEAMSKKDYRLGVRLVFLYALKMLSDKNHIHWDQGKTNHDYLEELKMAELKGGFSDLNYYFEYAWYGNFQINAEMFNHVQDIFKNWRTNIK